MLVKINKQEAFELLINKKTYESVFIKRTDKYLRASDHLWRFGDGVNGIDFHKAEFYKEIEDKQEG